MDPSSGTVNLRAVFPNPDDVLLPGMFVRAVVQEGINKRAILIPQEAVSRDPKGNPLTLIVDTEGNVRQQPIEIDRAVGNQWLITGGLAPGEQIIIEGMLKVRPGMKVRATPSGRDEKRPMAQATPAPATAGN